MPTENRVFDLRIDPFERATSSIYYAGRQVQHAFYLVPAQGSSPGCRPSRSSRRELHR
jgi:hypothetical protein